MRLRAGAVALLLGGHAAAQWTPAPVPTRTPRPAATARPTVAPTAAPAIPTATVTPTPTRPLGAPTPACPPAYVREFVFAPGIPLNAPEPGTSLRFADGGEFVVIVRFASAGDVAFRLVRVR